MTSSDTQWPRYHVFLQEREGEPFQDVGSVHAVDDEMALQNARDVFVRRPEAVSLWVVPAAVIYSRTAQELAEDGFGQEMRPGQPEAYWVSCKRKAAGTQMIQGEVTAAHAVEALQQGIACYAAGQAGLVWWVFPQRAVRSTQPEDFAAMFAPAAEKTFRMPEVYLTLTEMRKIKQKGMRHGS